MTLDKAIARYEIGAKLTWNGKPTVEAEECQQLAEWLKDYKRLLEQEPFINKPCVSEKVCEHDKQIVLDKIRSEVTAITINGQVDEHTMFIRTGEQVKQMALGIIDKYMTESE